MNTKDTEPQQDAAPNTNYYKNSYADNVSRAARSRDTHEGADFRAELTSQDSGEVARITMDTPLAQHNIGYQLLLKRGWDSGTGLGRNGQGRRDPVKIDFKNDFLGLGKQTEYDEYHSKATIRPVMQAEKEETEQHRADAAIVKQERESKAEEIRAMNEAFLCTLCDKQYKTVAEYDIHLSSYDHNHKKRLADLKQMSKASAEDVKERQRRDRKRQDKATAKLMQQATALQQQQHPGKGGVTVKAGDGGGGDTVTEARRDEVKTSGVIDTSAPRAKVAMKFGMKKKRRL